MSRRKLVLFATLLLFAFILIFAPIEMLSLEYLKSRHGDLLTLYSAQPILVIASYCVLYLLVASLSLPGATILTIAGGSIFGFVAGVVIVSFASTIGATFAFLVSRYLFLDFFTQRYPELAKRVQSEFNKEGSFYLFALRLVPIFPFFLVNVLMAFTSIGVWRYFFVSQIGMLPGTAAYVNAGLQLSDIQRVGDVISFPVLGSFALLGLLPLCLKRVVEFLRDKRMARRTHERGGRR